MLCVLQCCCVFLSLLHTRNFLLFCCDSVIVINLLAYTVEGHDISLYSMTVGASLSCGCRETFTSKPVQD